jgi:hypothetical protein
MLIARRPTKLQRRWLATMAICFATGALGAVRTTKAQVPTAPTVRTLNGLVTDTSHEPIRGAVVELRNEKSSEVVTYITDASGRYDFKRLDGNADYAVWVIFRGHHSPTRAISKFNSHMAMVLNFSIRTY